MISWFRPPPPVIDDGRLADVDLLAAIHAVCFHRGWSAEELEALIVQDRISTLVARRASPFGTRRPVGFAMVRSAAGESEILTIAVEPKWRGRGIGRALVETALRRLYHDRVTSLFLEVEESNEAALALYRRMRFREVGRRRNYYSVPGGVPSTALVMRRDLT